MQTAGDELEVSSHLARGELRTRQAACEAIDADVVVDTSKPHDEAYAGAPEVSPSYARLISAMSIFFICSMDWNARFDFVVSGSFSISSMARGTTCHETPYLSFSQPHCCALGSPPAVKRSQ